MVKYIIAFVLGFVLGPIVIDYLKYSGVKPEDRVLVQEQWDWKCAIGFECFTNDK